MIRMKRVVVSKKRVDGGRGRVGRDEVIGEL